MKSSFNRRQFLAASTLAAGFHLLPKGRSWAKSPNEKLNIGCIGTAGRAAGDIDGVKGENIVALCDVDAGHLAKAGEKFPGAKRYADFRRMLEQKDMDAVVVGTPDHTHAVCCVGALRSGRHVYCEKPLSHTVSEARIITDTARKEKRVTQMGNQIHAGANYRRVVELIQTKAIGEVSEVHVWAGAIYGNKIVAPNPPPPPPQLDFALWLGPVQYMSYRPEYVPFHWRHFWHFGGGTLADFWCHFSDLAHWALNLKYPLTIEATGPKLDPELVPIELTVRYTYPERKDATALLSGPPVNLTWYQGGKKPARLNDFLPAEVAAKMGSGVLFIGTKGALYSDYGSHRLLPEKDFTGFVKPAPYIPDSIGHHAEWILACKTGGVATRDFAYAGPLTEAGLLGNVAFRVGKKLDWDWKNLKARGCPEADQYIQHRYREGWKI